MGASSDFLGYSVLSDKSFLSEPSNAQVLQQQQIQAEAGKDFRKYLMIGAVLAVGVFLVLRLRK